MQQPYWEFLISHGKWAVHSQDAGSSVKGHLPSCGPCSQSGSWCEGRLYLLHRIIYSSLVFWSYPPLLSPSSASVKRQFNQGAVEMSQWWRLSCSYRGSWVNFLHPQSTYSQSVTAVPWELLLLSDLFWAPDTNVVHRHVYRQNTPMHKKIKIFFKSIGIARCGGLYP